MSTRKSRWRLFATVLATAVIAATMPTAAEAAGGLNLALGKQVQASSSNGPYGTGNVNDGNAASYWESTNNRSRSGSRSTCGANTAIDQVVHEAAHQLGHPHPDPGRCRAASTAVRSTTCRRRRGGCSTSPPPNVVTINFTAASVRYVRVTITANNGWPAGQLSEFEIYGAAGNAAADGTGEPRVHPAGLRADPAHLDRVDVRVGHRQLPDLRQRRAAGDRRRHRPGVHRHAAGHGDSRVLREGDRPGRVTRRRRATTSPGPAPPRRTARTWPSARRSRPTRRCSRSSPRTPTTATSAPYWESNGFTGILTVKLGSNADVSSVVVKLNPDTAWGPRTQAIQVLGREQSATGFTPRSRPAPTTASARRRTRTR